MLKRRQHFLKVYKKKRDDAKKKTKVMEMESERLKQEIQRLTEACSASDNKVFAIQLESQKLKTNFDKLLQEERKTFENEKEEVSNFTTSFC